MLLVDGKNKEFTVEEIKKYGRLHRFCVPTHTLSIQTDDKGQRKVVAPENWGIPCEYELLINPNDLEGVSKKETKRKVKVIYYETAKEHETNKNLTRYEPHNYVIPKTGFVDITDYELNFFMMNHANLDGGVNQDKKKNPLFWLYDKKVESEKTIEGAKIKANLLLKIAEMKDEKCISLANAISVAEPTHNFQNRFHQIENMEPDEIKQELMRLADTNPKKFMEFIGTDEVDCQKVRLKLLELDIIREKLHESGVCVGKNEHGQYVQLFKYKPNETETQGWKRFSEEKKQKYSEFALRIEEIPA